jgi:hypothetical protein
MPLDVAGDSVPFFWDQFPSLIGDAIYELASPDINPNGSYSEIVYARVEDASDDDFLDPNGPGYYLSIVALDGSTETDLTERSPFYPDGNYDYAPDFSPSGNTILFTRSNYAITSWIESQIGLPPGTLNVPVTNLYISDRTGQLQWPIFNILDGEFVSWVQVGTTFTVTMHQPMFPNYSPDGNSIIFMDCPVVFDFDIVSGMLTPQAAPYRANVYRVGMGIFHDWADVTPVVDDATLFEIFPDWGIGGTVPAYSNKRDNGDEAGRQIAIANTSVGDDVGFDQDERRDIALDLGEASLALRASRGYNQYDQDWRLKDLPSVPEHVVSVLRGIADMVSFRDPLVSYDPRYKPPDPLPPGWQPSTDIPLQAYPGRININTASRPVLRSLLLLMFQGPMNDVDDDTDENAPCPRIDAGTGFQYLNLLDPTLIDEYRFQAMMVANTYAHQVCEYRKWIYNNPGSLGVTDETVPSNLPLYEARFATTGHYGNYRANPFYPLVDTDQDSVAPDVPTYDPEPPFRSIADLFRVALYDGDVVSEDWLYEGVDAPGGPDLVNMPRPMDTADNEVGTVNEMEVWGPIYMTYDEQWCSHPDAPLGGGVLRGYSSVVDNDYTNAFPDYNHFYEHQMFRLFSADDFRRIAPYITVRSYTYRIESRGVVRVASGARRTDVTRDKIWIVTTNTEANFAGRLSPTFDLFSPYQTSNLAWNEAGSSYYTVFFEETPQSGLGLTRSDFVPE